MKKTVAIRKDYIKRLIAGARKVVRAAPENVEARKYGRGAINIRWLDIVLLCDVVEADLLLKKRTRSK